MIGLLFIPPWQRWAALAIALLGVVTMAFCAGERHKAQAIKLATNATLIKANADSLNKETRRVGEANKQDSILVTYRTHVREKIVVRHDTILVADKAPVVSPEIAQLLVADDSTIKALQRSIALRDTLIASLRGGIALRDDRVKLLESEVSPGRLKRLGTAVKWIAIGAIAGAAFVHR